MGIWPGTGISETGWLDVNTFIASVSATPRLDGEGVLIAFGSNLIQKVIAFGAQSLSGIVLFKIGIKCPTAVELAADFTSPNSANSPRFRGIQISTTPF